MSQVTIEVRSVAEVDHDIQAAEQEYTEARQRERELLDLLDRGRGSNKDEQELARIGTRYQVLKTRQERLKAERPAAVEAEQAVTEQTHRDALAVAARALRQAIKGRADVGESQRRAYQAVAATYKPRHEETRQALLDAATAWAAARTALEERSFTVTDAEREYVAAPLALLKDTGFTGVQEAYDLVISKARRK